MDGKFRRRFTLHGRRSSELDEEMAFHQERIVEELVESGWDEVDARAEARRRFGDPEQFRDACVDDEGMRGTMMRWFDVVRQDVGFAVRQLVRRPLVNGLALVTLVLGVGATALVFSVVDAVVLEALPFSEPDRLVRVSQTTPGGRAYSISEANFVDFRARQRTMVEMAAMGFSRQVLTGVEEAAGVQVMRVSHTFFPLLGTEPVLGRHFTPDEDVRGGPDGVVLLSESTWESHFGRDPGVLGSTLTLDGVPREIIGVVPSDRAWPGVHSFVPLSPHTVEQRDNQIIESFGRLRDGVSLAEAQADLSGVAAQLSDEYPESNDQWGAIVRPFESYFVGQRLSRLGYLLLAAVGLLLLMACSSVTNLRVAQASARLQEMSVRAALGAGRRRITAQLLIEGTVLAVVGGAVAVLFTTRALPVIQALGPSNMGRLHEASVDGTVLLATLAAALLAVIVSGLAPAFLISRSGIFDSLRASGAPDSAGARLRSALVVGQFALAVAVVVSASLMMKSFAALTSVELGFQPEGMVQFHVRLPDERFERGERYPQLAELMEELGAIPGVTATAVSHAPPFGWMTPGNFVARTDREPDRQQDFLPVSWRAVAGDYFETAGIPVVAGRTFRPEENLGDQSAHNPIVIDQRLAQLLWPDGEDPVGKTLTWFLPGGQHCEIVGVVGNVQDEQVSADGRPRVYRPYGWTSWYEPGVMVRTAGDPGLVVPAIREAARRIDPDAPAMSVRTVREEIREAIAWPRFTLQILAAFSAAALLLAALGVYGVTAFNVSRRKKEIGLRLALGADASGILKLILRRSLVLAIIGIGIGTVASAAFSGLLRQILYEVSPTDPLVFVTVPAFLALIAIVASAGPARRATRLDPRTALTED